jgi:hypothetical protein
MKFFTAVFAFTVAGASFASDHHVKHNMVLFGEDEIFASHIVYKVPHNYQVILKVRFSEEIKEKYLATRRNNPERLLIFLLEPTDISQIEDRKGLSGSILIEDEKGKRTEVVRGVTLSSADYQVFYFNEVPKNLEGSHEH